MRVYVDNIGNVYRGGNEGQRYGYSLSRVSEWLMCEATDGGGGQYMVWFERLELG